jgi:hypothetical protein
MSESEQEQKTKYQELSDHIWDTIKENAKPLAKEFVPKLCEALEEEEKDPQKIGKRICTEFQGIWTKKTIYENMEDKYKSEEKAEAIKKGIEKAKAKKQTVAPKVGGGSELGQEEDSVKDLKKEIQQMNKRLEAQQNLFNDQKQKYETIRKENEDLKQAKQFTEVANTLDEQQTQQGDIRYYAFNFHNQQLNRDFARFLRIWKTLTEDVWVKVHENRVVRIITKEEKDKELEAIASV